MCGIAANTSSEMAVLTKQLWSQTMMSGGGGGGGGGGERERERGRGTLCPVRYHVHNVIAAGGCRVVRMYSVTHSVTQPVQSYQSAAICDSHAV